MKLGVSRLWKELPTGGTWQGSEGHGRNALNISAMTPKNGRQWFPHGAPLQNIGVTCVMYGEQKAGRKCQIKIGTTDADLVDWSHTMRGQLVHSSITIDWYFTKLSSTSMKFLFFTKLSSNHCFQSAQLERPATYEELFLKIHVPKYNPIQGAGQNDTDERRGDDLDGQDEHRSANGDSGVTSTCTTPLNFTNPRAKEIYVSVL